MRSNTRGFRWALLASLLGALSLLVVACGGEDEYKNNPRPASPINITAFISDQKVSVSPAKFGAGPIVLIFTNQSDAAQEVILETDELGGSQAGLKQSAGPINPGDTGQIKADVREGRYTVRTANGQIGPATVMVGAPRKSAQDNVLEP